MRINFHSLVLAPAVLAAAFFAAQPVHAASVYRVHVPFDFVASGKNMPAGDYTIRQGAETHAVQFEGKNSSMLWIVGPGTANPGERRVILTFDKIGNSHMLRTLQVGPVITVRLDKKYANALVEEERIQAGE